MTKRMCRLMMMFDMKQKLIIWHSPDRLSSWLLIPYFKHHLETRQFHCCKTLKYSNADKSQMQTRVTGMSINSLVSKPAMFINQTNLLCTILTHNHLPTLHLKAFLHTKNVLALPSQNKEWIWVCTTSDVCIVQKPKEKHSTYFYKKD